MARQRVALYHLHEYNGPAIYRKLAELADALPAARLAGPDWEGLIEAEIDAADQEDSLQKVWDAIAATGADDHVVIAEHPDLPEHWRARAGGPRARA
jgi:hypothetical protein